MAAIPLSVIEDDALHNMAYCQSLPYGHLLEDETTLNLTEILDNLILSVKIKDFAPGALTWVKRLSNYLDLKHGMPRNTRARLALILFEMVVIPGMDYALVEIWANTCVRLIRKKKKIGPEDLELPWRPLYEMIEKNVFVKSRQKTLISEAKNLTAIIRLVEYSQRFFNPKATKEILDEFLPQYTTHSIHKAMIAQGYLVLFLPTTMSNLQQSSPGNDSIIISPKDYLPTIFSLWSNFTRSSTYDAQFMDLVARIAENNIDHGDQLMFNKQQIKTIFTTSLRLMNLPVGSRDNSGGAGLGDQLSTGYGHAGYKIDMKAGHGLFLRRKSEKFTSLAKFIVYVMVPDKENNGKSYSLTLLADLIQAVELYFHPSNHGTWSYVLTTFVRHLAYQFLKRWRQEHEEDCEIPAEKRITPEMCKEFVLILRPVTFLSMFGKDQYTVGASQTTIKYLSWIEPHLIFPSLLERMYPSLETLTETHRTTSALSILADVSLPLLSRDHYPAGGKHLLPLLHLTLPGIDMNDPIKTVASLMFIVNAIMTVPIIDLTDSQLTPYQNNTSTIQHSVYDNFNDDSMLDEDNLPKEVEDNLCRLTTGEFEEWVALFLRRIFTVFENLPQHDRKKQGGDMEQGLTQMVLYACETVFGQLGDKMFDIALKLVADFATSQVIPNAVRAMGSLCDSITSANPEKSAKKLIDICITNIRMELEHGASSALTNAASSTPIQSDATLHWYQHILFSVVISLGSLAVQYKDQLLDIGQYMIQHCKTRRGFMWSGKFIRHLLKTILDIYPKEYRSLVPEEWKNIEIMANSHLLWGKTGDPQKINIDWHTPNEEEKNLALEALDLFLQPSMKRLRELMDSTTIDRPTNSHELTNEFCRHLAVLRNCVIGSMALVNDDGESIDSVNDSGEDEVIMEKTHSLIAGYAFSDESDPRTEIARRIRKDIGDLLHDLAVFFIAEREDDVESLKILVKILRTYLSERGVEKSWLDLIKNGYSYTKYICKTPICHKRYPRHLLVHRAFIHHLQRLRQNSSNRIRAPIHDQLLKDLLELSMSSYAEIRKVSQSALSVSARSFKGSKSIIMPIIIDTLKPKPEMNSLVYSNRIKGALYLLTHKSIILACLRDWRYIPEFVLSLCNAQHEDKLSIQELIRKIFLDYLTYFNQCSFRVITSATFDHALQSFEQTVSLTKTPMDIDNNNSNQLDELKQKVNERLQRQKERHKQLTESLIELLLKGPSKDKLHWRFATMASNFLELLLRPELVPTSDLATFANNCTVSELPAMRRIGISTTTQLLLYIKLRTFANGNEDMLITKSTRNPLKQTRLTADLFNDEDKNFGEVLLKQTAEPIKDSSFLIDDTTVGWYVWPKQVTGYIPYSDSIHFPPIDSQSQEAYNTFLTTFASPEYWNQLISYMSQEPSQNKLETRLNSANVRFYKSIFQIFYQFDEQSPYIQQLSKIIECAKEQLTILCQAAEQKNSQRAAAELAAGLIRGMKHWPIEFAEKKVWSSWLYNLLRTALQNVTPDSHSYWSAFISFSTSKRDPRRVQPLIQLILDAKFDPYSDAAFNEARKLLYVRNMMANFNWRFHPWTNDLLQDYLLHLNHPYKQVRDSLGSNINDITQLQWIPSYDSVDTLLNHHIQLYATNQGIGDVPYTLEMITPNNPNLVKHQQLQLDRIIECVDKEILEMKSTTVTLSSSSSQSSSSSEPLSTNENVNNGKANQHSNACKTVLYWLRESLTHWQIAGTLPYVTVFLPRVFQMQEIKDEQDLQAMANRVLNLMASMTYSPPQIVAQLIDQLLTILTTSKSWHIRVRTLPILQVFFFKHIFAMELNQVISIMDAVGGLLLDEKIEVRTLAGVTLGGLVRCSQRGAIDSIRQRYADLLLNTKLPKRYRHEQTGKLIEPKGFSEALLRKHAGALGLACLVNAFPYEIPDWMPTVLCQLADCMSDPAEIQTTIRKTFSDFRRTHSDTWHEDMTKFTEDQLSILSDMLISPSYYA